jgi:hypothetical protein
LLAAGSKLTTGTLREIQAEADKILRMRDAGVPAADIIVEVRRAAIKQVKSVKLQRAAASYNFTKIQAHREAAMTQVPTKPWRYLRAMLDPAGADIEDGFKRGVRVIEQGLRSKYLGGMRSRLLDLDPSGALEKLWASGVVDQEVSRVLWALNNKTDPSDLITKGLVSDNAVKIGRVLHEVQAMSIRDAHKRLIPIEFTDLFVTSTTHDGLAIKKAGFDTWFETFKQTFDLKYRATPEEVERVARDFYNHITAGVFPKNRDDPQGFGYRSRSVMLAHERAFVPKSADLWHAYNAEYGTGNLRETFSQTMTRRAKDIALVDVFGTTPEANFWKVFQDIQKALEDKPEIAKRFAAKEAGLRNLLHATVGLTDVPVNETLAKYGNIARAMSRMAVYGGSLLSQPSDLAIAASALRFQGFNGAGKAVERGFLSGIFDLMKGLTIAENKSAVRMLEYVSNEYIHAIGEAASAHRGPEGVVMRLQDKFFNINGQGWWTNRLRVQAEVITSNELASWAGRAFDKLPEGTQRLFQAHDITPEMWDVMRLGKETAEDGEQFLTARGVNGLTDSVFESFKSKTGDTREAGAIREDISDRLRAYLIDRLDEATSQPFYRERAILGQGAQAGTPIGELARTVAMTKSFPAAILVRTIARELHAYGVNNIYRAILNGETGYGLAQLFWFSTLLGYVSLSARDLLAGRSLRDPSDARTWGVSFARGGALGFYGDLIFGASEKSYSGNAVTAMMGPLLGGTVPDIFDLGVKLTKISDREDGDKLAANALRTVYRNVPGNNLLFIKPVIDYGLMYGLMESLSPGYLHRMEQNFEKNTGSTYWLPPSINAR